MNVLSTHIRCSSIKRRAIFLRNLLSTETKNHIEAGPETEK